MRAAPRAVPTLEILRSRRIHCGADRCFEGDVILGVNANPDVPSCPRVDLGVVAEQMGARPHALCIGFEDRADELRLAGRQRGDRRIAQANVQRVAGLCGAPAPGWRDLDALQPAAAGGEIVRRDRRKQVRHFGQAVTVQDFPGLFRFVRVTDHIASASAVTRFQLTKHP